MNAHTKAWKSVIEELRAEYGDDYNPKDRQEVEPTLVRMLFDKLRKRGYQRSAIASSVQGVFERKKSLPSDWASLLPIFLCALPAQWVKLTNDPGFAASTMLLLTDGTVMVQEAGGLRWKLLTPDSSGSYIDGTWSDLAPMHNTRLYYASAVLRDGRVFVSGGEDGDGGDHTNKTEIYDPTTDTWTQLNPPPNWTNVGDAPSAVLPDGRILLGHYSDQQTYIYDPAADTWTTGPNKGSSSSEESWVLMPDDTVITVRCDGSMKSDRYSFANNTWTDGGNLPVNIIEIASSEIGAGVLLPDGRALFAGATGKNALYSMPLNPNDPGTWTAAPDFPNDPAGRTVGCKDAPACLMVNGRVLIAAGPVDGQENDWLTPTYFHEFRGTSMYRVSDPPNAAGVPYNGRMLLLPTGEILFAAGTNEIYAYSYFPCFESAWQPNVSAYPTFVRWGFTYNIQGTNFNGLSQAVGYGDDASAATNYPLVQITNNASGNVFYCRTFDHSSMGVATGSTSQSTMFEIPFGMDTGPSELCVIANGIPSDPVPIDVAPWPIFWQWRFLNEKLLGPLIESLSDGPPRVLGPHGPVAVDPKETRLSGEALAAREKVLDGITTLQKLGRQIHGDRLRKAGAVRPAQDPEANTRRSHLKVEPGVRTNTRTRRSPERAPDPAAP